MHVRKNVLTVKPSTDGMASYGVTRERTFTPRQTVIVLDLTFPNAVRSSLTKSMNGFRAVVRASPLSRTARTGAWRVGVHECDTVLLGMLYLDVMFRLQ